MENNHENEFEKKPYDPDAQYGFPSRNNSTSRGYNLNGTYYESTSNYEDYADVESKGWHRHIWTKYIYIRRAGDGK